MFIPIFESALNAKAIPMASVDLSSYDNPLWEAFDIKAVPTVIFFRDGKSFFRKDGTLGLGLSKKDMEELLNQMSGGRQTAFASQSSSGSS